MAYNLSLCSFDLKKGVVGRLKRWIDGRDSGLNFDREILSPRPQATADKGSRIGRMYRGILLG